MIRLPKLKAMKRRVSSPISLTESPGSCKGARKRILKQVSELHMGTLKGNELKGGCVTGAPVIELQYKHEIHAVLRKVLMATSEQTGVVPRHVNLVPKTNVLEVGFFYWSKKHVGG